MKKGNLSNLLFIIIIALFIFYCNVSKSKELKIVKQIPIIENDSCVISSVSNADTKSNLCLITDSKDEKIILIDINTGIIIHYFEPGYHLTDSLLKYLEPNDTCFYFSYKEAVDEFQIYKNYEDAQRFVKNNFGYALFNDNNIVISSIVRYFEGKVDNSERKIKTIINSDYSLIIFNLNQLEEYKFHPIIPKGSFFYFRPNRNYIFIDSNNIIGVYESTMHFLNNNKALSHEIGKYNLINDSCTPILNLPDEYYDTRIGYNLLNTNIIKNNKNEILCTFGLLPKIFNLTQHTEIDLKPIIKNDNQSMIDSLLQTVNNNKISMLTDLYLTPIKMFIKDFYQLNSGDYIISLSEIVDGEKRARIIKIDENFNFDSEFKIEIENSNGIMAFIKYDTYSNNMIIFRKSKEKGWTMEFYQI